MSKLYDVIIAGAGPVGLLLASELGLTRASVLVLESSPKPESPWKVMPLGMRGLKTPSVEAMYRRGLLDKLTESSEQPTNHQKVSGFQLRRHAGHFAGIMLDTKKFDLERWKYRLAGPALNIGLTTTERLEAVLSERAESVGVKILRGCGVTKIVQQDDNSVTVEAGEDQSFRGRWLVGCDGGRSVVRKAAGIEFVGTEPLYTGYSAKCDLSPPDKLKPGFHATTGGMYIFAPPNCVHLIDFDGATFDRTQDITREHFQDALRRVAGVMDVEVKTLHLASSSTDRCKQAATYRKGRVLLAGDAAHIHSPLGAQGLNLGLGDATNLGWKLAATVRQETKSEEGPADLTLLDTYETERFAIGAWALGWTRAQVSTLKPDPYGTATREIGLSQRYKLGESEAHSHPLVGCSAPDFELLDGTRLGSKLERGHGLLLDFEDSVALRELLAGGEYHAQVDYLGIAAKDTCGLRALLIRPDGVVAWLAEDKTEPDLSAAKAALRQWFSL